MHTQKYAGAGTYPETRRNYRAADGKKNVNKKKERKVKQLNEFGMV